MVEVHSGARWEAWTCGRCVLVQDLTSDLLPAHMSELVERLFAVCPAAEARPRSLDRISDPPPPPHSAPPLTNKWRFLRAAGNSAARLSAETQTRRLTHSLKSDSERTERAQNAPCLTVILVRPQTLNRVAALTSDL